MSSSDEHLRKLLEETERRKEFWKVLASQAQEAYKTAIKQAQKSGVEGTSWIPEKGVEVTWYNAPSRATRHHYRIMQDGTLKYPLLDEDRPYQGYPNLNEFDLNPRAFLEALLAQLYEHLGQMREDD